MIEGCSAVLSQTKQIPSSFIMLPLVLLFAAAFASGPPIVLDDPTLCLPSGYISGVDFGLDCCTFVVCDNARLNKTGFQGKCMGGTVWNQALLVCDDAKYVPDCDPTTCDVPKRTNAECADPQPSGTTCCVGQNRENGKNGYEPVFTAGSSPENFIRGNDREEQSCPFGQVFVLESCCCEYEYAFVEPCTDTSGYYFANPEDGCCSYLQCWVNRTGFDVVPCMAPSVWNDDNKTCDIVNNVMDCMGVDCGPEMTDAPCPDSFDGDCCRNGLFYTLGPDSTQYTIAGAEGNDNDRLLCCPVNMAGEQMVFNADPDVCCCEVEEF
ncbi:unnamed protein product [Owenia fusiformis]|uniref:Chitin-binding type-2 domain-containing protein n=1 Tax=Owenia fusiformis TaxID=6347 RepID=A0A8S4NLD8_OWEFU|nr:unnamed protein product [Owenia fusiformis]